MGKTMVGVNLTMEVVFSNASDASGHQLGNFSFVMIFKERTMNWDGSNATRLGLLGRFRAISCIWLAILAGCFFSPCLLLSSYPHQQDTSRMLASQKST